jgi:hypothetical protein
VAQALLDFGQLHLELIESIPQIVGGACGPGSRDRRCDRVHGRLDREPYRPPDQWNRNDTSAREHHGEQHEVRIHSDSLCNGFAALPL